MASQPKKPKTVLIRMRVSPILHGYLGVLSRTTMKGASENDVAETVLTQALEKLFEEKAHEKSIPK